MLIPLRTDEPTRKLPIITIMLIGANMIVLAYGLVYWWTQREEVLMFVGLEHQIDLDRKEISEHLHQKFRGKRILLSQDATVRVKRTGNRWLIADRERLYVVKREADKLKIYREVKYSEALGKLADQYGAIPRELVYMVDESPLFPYSHYLSLLAYMFMHGGFVHIIGNMLFLNTFGPNVEDYMGHFKFFVFYILCGVVSAMVYVIPNFNSPVPLVGASGAIAGIMGAHIRVLPGTRILCLLFFVIRITLPAIVILFPWILLQFYNVGMGGQSNVAWIAHIGGFFLGMFLVRAFQGKRERKPQNYYYN